MLLMICIRSTFHVHASLLANVSFVCDIACLQPGNTTVTYNSLQAFKVLCFQKTVCDTLADGIPTVVTVAGVGSFIIPDCTCLSSPVIYFKLPVKIVIVTYSTAVCFHTKCCSQTCC